jgi:hypothetical protein
VTDEWANTELIAIRASRATAATQIAPILAAEKEAAALAARNQCAEAVSKFDAILAQGKDLQVKDPSASQFLARISAQRAKAQAGYEEQLAEKARQEEAERKKAEQERQRQAELERRRQEESRRAAEAALLHARQMLLKSPAYAAWKAEAARILSAFRIDQAGEDSAYRSKSRAARVMRRLMGIYVDIQGKLQGTDVVKQVAAIEDSSERDLVLEDSAIRTVYKCDQATLDLLGVWAQVLDSRHPGTRAAFEKVRAGAIQSVLGDDSAPRAEAAFSGACMEALRLIVAAEGQKQQADAILSNFTDRNLVEDSAYRASTINTEGVLRLLLLIVEQRDAKTAKRIGSGVDIATIGETSALRMNARQREAVVEALNYLVTSY